MSGKLVVTQKKRSNEEQDGIISIDACKFSIGFHTIIASIGKEFSLRQDDFLS